MEEICGTRVGKKKYILRQRCDICYLKNVDVSVIYTHMHKVFNYFAISGLSVDQQYVYHLGRRWTTDGPPVANLTIFCVIKFRTTTFGK